MKLKPIKWKRVRSGRWETYEGYVEHAQVAKIEKNDNMWIILYDHMHEEYPLTGMPRKLENAKKLAEKYHKDYIRGLYNYVEDMTDDIR